MKVVLDVSAAFSVIVGARDSEKFLSDLESATEVLAPDLFYAEATNTAWKFHHIEDASVKESQLLLANAIALIDTFTKTESLSEDALNLACKIEHSAYDCFYLTLASKEKAGLLTKDKRLSKMATGLGILVF